MIPELYKDGTVVVTNGSTTVTGVGTAWSTRARRGSLLIVNGVIGIVASDPESDDTADHPQGLEIELTEAWPGLTTPVSPGDEPYQLVILRAGSDLASGFADLIERLVGKGMGLVSSGQPLDSDGRDNDFRFNPTTRLLYFKVAGVWETVTLPVKFDAYDVFANRGAHDDKDEGFTFFATDTEEWWIKASDASADWQGPFSFRPAQDAGTGVTFDAQGSVIAAGHYADIRVTFNCQIKRVTLLADGVGSLVADIRLVNFGDFPPEAGDSICASAKPTLSAAQTYEDEALTGWNKSLVDGQVLRFFIESNTDITRVSIQLDVERQ